MVYHALFVDPFQVASISAAQGVTLDLQEDRLRKLIEWSFNLIHGVHNLENCAFFPSLPLFNLFLNPLAFAACLILFLFHFGAVTTDDILLL